MPPATQPNKLLKICYDSLNSLIIGIIISLFKAGESGVERKLKSIQQYILKNTYPQFLDDLLQTNTYYQLNVNQKLMLLKLFMHPRMVTFNTRFKLPLKDNFYEVRLKKLTSLVVLNLSMVCTDEILEVVGNSCPSLQVIHITSKIGSSPSSCLSTSYKKYNLNFNALKLHFFVSDKGLEHLHKCKLLNTVVMNKSSSSGCGGRKVTHEGIRKLLCAVPGIQFISNNDMGVVLEQGFDRITNLNLHHAHDCHVTPEHIELFFRHCPNLKGLCLILPTVGNNIAMPESCFFKLAKSKLNLSTLALRLFPMGDAFIHFLQLKGNHLTYLSIFNHNTINVDHVCLIGQYCPYIKYLDVNCVHPGPNDKQLNPIWKKKRLFTCLQYLKIIGSNWDPQVIVPLCINYALNLNQLTMVNQGYCTNMDEVILKLLKINPLAKLTSVSLLDGFCVTSATLMEFVLSLENLERITVVKGSPHIENLQKLKLYHNLNLSISDYLTEYFTRNDGNCFCRYWQQGTIRWRPFLIDSA